ncbi:anhydro-N-acetylmuramic acid kinase [Flavobacterium agrisoli]|uniref:Anhydro-N-acetylmuramic acid kinase n=1 Tax=Flavobacterium agrisoli TaxID=2793066 RepID=A0A934UKK7_9FLAO|nr:anhydro-N-acetylmuramic acid kinase [Flavobacterium agrisoli]MBK0370545.1 anhydro-N-acetylmuramic acid kinase [Flavobacterium agrisoli]
MKENYYNVIGVMSGTSLDGVDLAHIEFRITTSGKWEFEILETETIPYENSWIQQLKEAVHYTPLQLASLNENYTQLLAKIIVSFIEKHQLKNIDAVCSHGHTVQHQPQNQYTLQIGNLPQIATLTKQKVVCDFRVQDVLLGGQGAPLVPIGDRLLFSDYDYCINLGGFSNISLESQGNRIAFDISAVNTVLNYYANQLGLNYDNKGEISKSGQLNKTLFEQLNTLPYYQQSFPKSLGIEYVNETLLPILESYPIPTADKMHTFTQHIAYQTKKALPDLTKKILITGGGAYNTFLIDSLKLLLPESQIVIPNSKIIEFKEALIFALLGVLRLRNEINCLKSVTGASKDHSSGTIFGQKS